MVRSAKIIRIYEKSIAQKIGLQIGDEILAVDGKKPRDIIDFSFMMATEKAYVHVRHKNGQEEILKVVKAYDESLGVEFLSAVFDGIRSCRNRCHFCFIDQVPKNMRNSLYIKDDDYRLSFLYGNFITLTNVREEDFLRIQKYHLSPLFISVHTMNMGLRKTLLQCQEAEKLLEQLNKLEAYDIEYHAQIVLCPGLNDGKDLDQTIEELLKRRPYVQSVAVVPVGLTQFRQRCYPLKLFDKESALEVIEQVEAWQKYAWKKIGTRFVYLGDEFYLLGKKTLPKEEAYDGFPQLDNGIGLVRNFILEWQAQKQHFKKQISYTKPLHIDIVVGTSFAPCLKKLTDELHGENLFVNVIAVENSFFGKSVTVSGLLTGRDIIRSLRAENSTAKRDGIIIPASSLRTGDFIFLDDMPFSAVEKEFKVKIATALTGSDVFTLLADWYNEKKHVGEKKAIYTWQSNAAYTKP